MDVIIVLGMVSIVDDATSVKVQLELFAHRWSVWSGHRVRLWCSCGFLPTLDSYSGEWMEQFD